MPRTAQKITSAARPSPGRQHRVKAVTTGALLALALIVSVFAAFSALGPPLAAGEQRVTTARADDSMPSGSSSLPSSAVALAPRPQVSQAPHRASRPTPSAVPPPSRRSSTAPAPRPRATPSTHAASAPSPAASARGAERVIAAYVTGYSWYDNTPAGSSTVSNPVAHSTAGGTGTWADPITVAVGHSLATGRDVLRWAPGTRFYFPDLKRYVVVEDTCGNGSAPQDEPCSTGYPARDSTWLDVWIDGRSSTRSQTAACAEAITGSRTVIVNPLPGHPVSAGPIAAGGSCPQ
jgi:hypothetical protein